MDNLTAGNPCAHRVRVYYEGDEKIYEGMPLCYNFNTTKNWFGGSVSDGVVTATGTTAEGSQNEGKYIRVTNPIVISTTGGTPASGSKVITGLTTEFDHIEEGMFVNITGTNVTNGTYEVTDVNTTTFKLTLDMPAADGTTADVTVELNNFIFAAGFVAKGGWCGKTGPRVLDIYVLNGAIVPVRAYVDCNDKDVLYLVSGANYVNKTALSGALVAVAAEDFNRATTAGLILAKAVSPASIAGAALTSALTDLTHTAPGTPDYAIQDLTSTSPYGFATKDEGNTVLKVVQANKVRIAELEARLKALSLIA